MQPVRLLNPYSLGYALMRAVSGCTGYAIRSLLTLDFQSVWKWVIRWYLGAV